MLWAPFGFGLVKEWLAGGRKNNNKVFFLNKNVSYSTGTVSLVDCVLDPVRFRFIS